MRANLNKIFYFALLVLLQPVQVFASGDMDISEFISTVYVEGIPYEKALDYKNEENISKLIEIVGSDSHENYHTLSNAIVTLGMIGDDNAVNHIINFIERNPEGRSYSNDLYRAKTVAIFSLGYIVNHTKNERAMNYLENSANPKVWEERGVFSASNKYEDNLSEQYKNMSKYAVLGLALSGTEESRKALVDIRKNNAGKQSNNRIIGDREIRNLIAENESINSKGLEKYYKHSHK